MRVIGESKTVDLSKKLTVEISVGELAYITAMVGAQSVDSAKKAVDADFAVANRYKEDVKQYDNDDVYDELYEILKAEGVAE
jgi:hypothetical protein